MLLFVIGVVDVTQLCYNVEFFAGILAKYHIFIATSFGAFIVKKLRQHQAAFM